MDAKEFREVMENSEIPQKYDLLFYIIILVEMCNSYIAYKMRFLQYVSTSFKDWTTNRVIHYRLSLILVNIVLEKITC